MGPESVRIALRGISANKLRSSLTVLGILIGVGAVIMLVAVGNGSSIAVQERIQKLGVNTLTVSNRGRAGFGPQAPGTQSTSVKITQGDVDALNDKSQAPDIVSASPVVSVSSATAVYNTASTTVSTSARRSSPSGYSGWKTALRRKIRRPSSWSANTPSRLWPWARSSTRSGTART